MHLLLSVSPSLYSILPRDFQKTKQNSNFTVFDTHWQCQMYTFYSTSVTISLVMYLKKGRLLAVGML